MIMIISIITGIVIMVMAIDDTIIVMILIVIIAIVADITTNVINREDQIFPILSSLFYE